MAHQDLRFPSPSRRYEVISNNFILLEFEWDATFEEYRRRPAKLRKRAYARARFRKAYHNLKFLVRSRSSLPTSINHPARAESINESEATTIIDLTPNEDDDRRVLPVRTFEFPNQLALGTFLDLTMNEGDNDGHLGENQRDSSNERPLRIQEDLTSSMEGLDISSRLGSAMSIDLTNDNEDSLPQPQTGLAKVKSSTPYT